MPIYECVSSTLAPWISGQSVSVVGENMSFLMRSEGISGQTGDNQHLNSRRQHNWTVMHQLWPFKV